MTTNTAKYKQELEIKRSYWRQIITKWEQSGQKPTVYCQANMVNIDQFYYWRKKCSNASLSTNKDNFINLQVSDVTASDLQAIDMPNRSSNDMLQIDITLPNKVQCQLNTCISNVKELINYLGGISC